MAFNEDMMTAEKDLAARAKTLDAAQAVKGKIESSLGMYCEIVKYDYGNRISGDHQDRAHGRARHWTLNVYSSKGNLLLGHIEFQLWDETEVFKVFHNLCNRDQFKAMIGEKLTNIVPDH